MSKIQNISVEQIVRFLGDDYLCSQDINAFTFNNVKPINESNSTSLSWINPTRNDLDLLLEKSDATIIICGNFTDFLKKYPNRLFIKVNNPKLVFLRIVKNFFSEKQKYGIHPSAIVHSSAIIHPNSYVGPFVIIGKAEIGEHTIIHGNCSIGDNTYIKTNVEIKQGAVIGGDGFGYSKNENNEFEKFPHIGGVIIGDNVDIGANSCIDRGTLGNTIISRGAKIDNLVHIAHNVVIGENTTVIANSVIAGSTIIGDNTWISPSVCVRDGVTIGSNTLVGLGALVTKDIPDNEVWVGVPAKKIKDNK